MRFLLRSLLWLLFLTPFVAALLVWASLSATPLLALREPLSTQDIQRARQILQNHQRQGPRQTKAITLDARDLALVANLFLQQRLDGGVAVAIQDDRLIARAALHLPLIPVRPWLNIQLELREQAREPNLLRLRVGELTIPQPMAKWLLTRLLAAFYQTPHYRLVREVIDDIRLENGRLTLRYQWTPELARRARATLVGEGSPAEQAYAQALEQKLASQSRRVSLAKLLPPLFALAAARSDTGDPLQENLTLLGVLGAWAERGRTARLLGVEVEGLPPFRARLRRREDLARHFLISAMLAAHGGGSLADAAGVYKELSDADGGSGFSFVDLLADRAGTRFGLAATASAEAASRFQARVAAGVSEADLLPAIPALTEGLDLASFRRDYQGVDSPRYREVMAKIERRLDQSPLYGEH